MIIRSLKHLVRRALGAAGYSIRDVGRGVTGVDVLHDAHTLLAGEAVPILFDVGANVGQTTRAMLDEFGSAQIHAFEPTPATVEALRREVGHRPGVTIEAIAFGETEGIQKFNVTEDFSVNASFLKPTWNAGGGTVDVRVEAIDGYCSRKRIENISLLKIDTQGYDLHVLKGARGMLAAKRIKLYSCEAMFVPMYEGQATLRDLLAFADDVGYQLVGFYEQNYTKNKLIYLDALFAA